MSGREHGGTVDLVVTWVDGNDPDWRRRKAAVTGEGLTDDRKERYRDWDLLRYWFRGVERFAPWVRKVFFVCNQEPPAWLNTENGKLVVTRHEAFIPAEYRPTFSSHPIELNMHRIPGLSEQFVYFNDDMFLLSPVKETFFFKGGLPRDSAELNPLDTSDLKDGKERIFTIPLNNISYLNRDYAFHPCVRKHPGKWLNVRYGTGMIRNMMLLCWPRFVGFADTHLPLAFLRSSFEEAWKQDGDILDATSRRPIRNDGDVSPWLIRYRQLAEGRFSPMRPVRGAVFETGPEDGGKWEEVIRRQGKPVICLNDGTMTEEVFREKKEAARAAFQAILPERCGFEKA